MSGLAGAPTDVEGSQADKVLERNTSAAVLFMGSILSRPLGRRALHATRNELPVWLRFPL
ncbi:hypothetical protein D187_009850 [Cystobacter fuscus DSM 2262]|uniref:Uncharacterized protein n=1 Tax=Cystobacter fuscus (strain ATCC 25194 / DSM 2262 / NBRC 100088 / M29) TaxID=1242864 RepID=S9PHR6_CYSF2|nr:hypothetical protein D187_009850 [Cystobacter fuscus DSM 2262]